VSANRPESQPEIVTRGFVVADGEDRFLAQAKEMILETLERRRARRLGPQQGKNPRRP